MISVKNKNFLMYDEETINFYIKVGEALNIEELDVTLMIRVKGKNTILKQFSTTDGSMIKTIAAEQILTCAFDRADTLNKPGYYLGQFKFFSGNSPIGKSSIFSIDIEKSIA